MYVYICNQVLLGGMRNLVTSLPELEWTSMGAESTRISLLGDISCVAYTCQPDRGGGLKEVNPG